MYLDMFTCHIQLHCYKDSILFNQIDVCYKSDE